jgi:thioesterase domain-containing protein/aryl carrier-like protein
VVLDALPLNVNGKIDRRALPKAEFGDADRYEAPIGEVEETLAAIWAEVLDVPKVGRHDNFFELGGDSILCLQILSKAKASGHSALAGLQLRQLMLRPTIASLLGESGGSDGSLVALNRAMTDTTPLFCIHPGLGGIFDYRVLAEKLEGLRRTYGLACPMLEDLSCTYGSVEEMVDDYVERIVRKQPRGPYHLLGWSLGGALAAMAAARLEKRGEAVSFLGMVDSFIPRTRDDGAGGDHDQGTDWKETFKEQFQFIVPGFDITENLPDLDDPEDIGAISGLIDGFIESAAKCGKARKEAYAALGTEEMARMFVVGRRLSGLSLEIARLPALHVEPCYWWARGKTTEAKETLGEQLGSSTAAVNGKVVEADHAGMLHDATVLCDIALRLDMRGGNAR